MIYDAKQLIHLLGDERRREHVRFAAKAVVAVFRLEERTGRSARKVPGAQRIRRRAGVGLLREQDLHARPAGDAFQDLQIARQRAFVNDVPRHVVKAL